MKVVKNGVVLFQGSLRQCWRYGMCLPKEVAPGIQFYSDADTLVGVALGAAKSLGSALGRGLKVTTAVVSAGVEAYKENKK